jgi:hypothetical protein
MLATIFKKFLTKKKLYVAPDGHLEVWSTYNKLGFRKHKIWEVDDGNDLLTLDQEEPSMLTNALPETWDREYIEDFKE